MLRQDVDHLLARLAVALRELELLERLVLADEVRRRVREQITEALEGGALEGALQILDDVELDAALAQDVQRAARLASTGVVIDDHPAHAVSFAVGGGMRAS